MISKLDDLIYFISKFSFVTLLHGWQVVNCQFSNLPMLAAVSGCHALEISQHGQRL
jgi:hypothetical protein